MLSPDGTHLALMTERLGKSNVVYCRVESRRPEPFEKIRAFAVPAIYGREKLPLEDVRGFHSESGQVILKLVGERTAVFDRAGGRELRRLSAGGYFTFSPEGRRLVRWTTRDAQSDIRMWDTATGQEVLESFPLDTPVYGTITNPQTAFWPGQSHAVFSPTVWSLRLGRFRCGRGEMTTVTHLLEAAHRSDRQAAADLLPLV